jgi:threonine dehydrogenase-like Zn-dependent dehydrogenase
MTSTVSPGTGTIDTDPFVHMAFLISSPARVLALRLAMSRVIRDNSVVLDAGCGALGLLAIIAARLGAARVVAVDVAPLDFAQMLASENGVSDRIDFIQGDLHEVALPVQSFDVIVGMIYNNEVKRDLGQHNLMSTLVKRHSHIETAIIPNRVRYSVAGYDCPLLDEGDSKRIVEWETHIENTERHTGVTFSALRELLDRVPPLFQIMGAPRRGAAYNQVGYFDRSSMTLLTERKLFTEIDYNVRSDSIAYPEAISLPVIHAGRLNAIVWQQDIVFDDILIRTTESMNPVVPAALVETGDSAVLSTGADWQDGVPLKIEKR